MSWLHCALIKRPLLVGYCPDPTISRPLSRRILAAKQDHPLYPRLLPALAARVSNDGLPVAILNITWLAAAAHQVAQSTGCHTGSGPDHTSNRSRGRYLWR